MLQPVPTTQRAVRNLFPCAYEKSTATQRPEPLRARLRKDCACTSGYVSVASFASFLDGAASASVNLHSAAVTVSVSALRSITSWSSAVRACVPMPVPATLPVSPCCRCHLAVCLCLSLCLHQCLCLCLCLRPRPSVTATVHCLYAVCATERMNHSGFLVAFPVHPHFLQRTARRQVRDVFEVDVCTIKRAGSLRSATSRDADKWQHACSSVPRQKKNHLLLSSQSRHRARDG